MNPPIDIAFGKFVCSELSSPQRLKGFYFSGGKDPLSNVSAGTDLPATAKSAGDTTPKMAPIRGRQFSVGYSQGWLVYLVSVKMAFKILRLIDVEGLAKTYLMHGNREKSVGFMKTVFLRVFCSPPSG